MGIRLEWLPDQTTDKLIRALKGLIQEEDVLKQYTSLLNTSNQLKSFLSSLIFFTIFVLHIGFFLPVSLIILIPYLLLLQKITH